jgi:hypothetical protein
MNPPPKGPPGSGFTVFASLFLLCLVVYPGIASTGMWTWLKIVLCVLATLVVLIGATAIINHLSAKPPPGSIGAHIAAGVTDHEGARILQQKGKGALLEYNAWKTRAEERRHRLITRYGITPDTAPMRAATTAKQIDDECDRFIIAAYEDSSITPLEVASDRIEESHHIPSPAPDHTTAPVSSPLPEYPQVTPPEGDADHRPARLGRFLPDSDAIDDALNTLDPIPREHDEEVKRIAHHIRRMAVDARTRWVFTVDVAESLKMSTVELGNICKRDRFYRRQTVRNVTGLDGEKGPDRKAFVIDDVDDYLDDGISTLDLIAEAAQTEATNPHKLRVA